MAQRMEPKLRKIFHLCDSHGKRNRPRKMSTERKVTKWTPKSNPKKWSTYMSIVAFWYYVYIVWSAVIYAKRYLYEHWWMLLFCLFVSFRSALSIFHSLSSSRIVLTSMCPFYFATEINRRSEWYFISIDKYFSGSSIICHAAYEASIYYSFLFICPLLCPSFISHIALQSAPILAVKH